ncbi:MAG TPA: hypothetical protein VH257_21220, partial [Chloroflexota bacterium]|nr:hypothetical protein [Chloroflexota bacterium]
LVVEGTLNLNGAPAGAPSGTPEGTPEGAQLVSIAAPEAVELTAHRQRGSGRLLVHLVNGSGGTPPRWAEPVPVHDLVLRFRLPAPAGDTAPAPAGRGATPAAGGAGALPVVRAARASAFLAPRPVAGGFEVTLPRLDLFELIAVEPPAGSERRTPPRDA